MKRMLMTTIGALSLAVTAGAQTPQTTPQSPSPTTPQSSSASASDTETSLTGCLKAGSEAGTFELQRGKKEKGASASASASGSASGSTGAAGTASAPSASASASMGSDKNAKLTAGAGVDLASHVGHTVQLSGSWSGAGASSASATGGTMSGRTFTVTNVKMISATCQTGTN